MIQQIFILLHIARTAPQAPVKSASFFGCRGSKIALRTEYKHNNKYIMALDDRQHVKVNANATTKSKGTTWEVEDYGSSPEDADARIIALKSIYKKYLSASEPKANKNHADISSTTSAHSTYLWKGAKFEVRKNDHQPKNQFWFKTAWEYKDRKNKLRPHYLLGRQDGYLTGDGTQYNLRGYTGAKFVAECVA